MKRAALLLLLALSLPAPAAVVRPAPDFALQGSGGRLSRFRGQPVVLVIARSPDSGVFKKQAKLLRELYEQFAARKVLFVAAFQEPRADRLPSDIPWIVANDGAKVAADYGIKGAFSIAVIGKDGNLDLLTPKVTTPERVRAVLVSSFPVQAAERK